MLSVKERKEIYKKFVLCRHKEIRFQFHDNEKNIKTVCMYQERFESIEENKVEKEISPCTRSTLHPSAREFIVTSPEKFPLNWAELSYRVCTQKMNLHRWQDLYTEILILLWSLAVLCWRNEVGSLKSSHSAHKIPNQYSAWVMIHQTRNLVQLHQSTVVWCNSKIRINSSIFYLHTHTSFTTGKDSHSSIVIIISTDSILHPLTFYLFDFTLSLSLLECVFRCLCTRKKFEINF